MTDSVTVSIYNVLHILDYIEWKVKAGYNDFDYLWQRHGQHFGIHPFSSHYLSVKIMPQSAKKVVTERYLEWEQKMHSWIDTIGEHYSKIQTSENLKEYISIFVKTWVDFINDGDKSLHMYEFWQFTNDLDEIIDDKFADVFPELSELLMDYSEKPDWWFLPTEKFTKE